MRPKDLNREGIAESQSQYLRSDGGHLLQFGQDFWICNDAQRFSVDLQQEPGSVNLV